MNALELMKQDHDTLRQLFDQALANDEADARAGLLHQIRAQLMAHEKMEEDVFYAALRSGGDRAKEIVMEGYVEHQIIEVILADLLEVPDDAEHWHAKLEVLKDSLEQHLQQEETEVFPRAKEALGHATLEELGKKMEQVKAATLV